ncbi:FG-GAP repeat domain-containing protein [Haloferula chungangensis]|uniref:FG-GAP repeat domain-containing protein n=1 Tax=Haloferula chungangensis TaxID=1048331 RepID=A0ABW2L221_9BACT
MFPVKKLILAALLVTASEAPAVINVGLQPADLFESRYDRVLILTIDAIDTTAGTISCKVDKALKGQAAANDITLKFDPSLNAVLAGAVADGDIKVGDPVAVFAGRKRRSGDFMLYANAFYLGSATTPGEWSITATSAEMAGSDGEQIGTLAGTWNGSTERLVQMLEDIAAGRDHFPRKAYVRFKEDQLLTKLDGPVNAVAAFDLEGDGDEDIIACSSEGDRIFLQTDPMKFIDATEHLGIESSSVSCAIADVDGDGLNDLLTGATLHLGKFENNRFGFSKSDLLPESLSENLKTATFAEIDGDGFPDILASIVGGGVRVFKNPGEAGGKFTDVSEAMGLLKPECGAGSNGYVTPGDWNGDHRTDLFLASGPGYLLVQNDAGQFGPVHHGIDFKFTVGIDETPGITGAGVFLPLIEPGKLELLVPMEESWLIVHNDNGKPTDITRWGNEISEGSNDHLSSIAEDLNLDGHVDFFTVSRADNGHNRFIINRGYGSFMLAPTHKHYEHVFKGPANERGGYASATADLNDDGAPDLVIGNAHGEVTIILNDTLEARTPIEHPPTEIARLEKVRLLQVRCLGRKGLVGASVQVLDANGRTVARRDIGSNVSSGSLSSARVTLAIREPGKYQLKVRFSDGLEKIQEVDLSEQARVTVDLERGDSVESDEF